MTETVERGNEPGKAAGLLDDLYDVAVPAFLRSPSAAAKVLRECAADLEAILNPGTHDTQGKPHRINQRRGPAIKFTGVLLAKTEFDLRDGREMRLELWQTEGGALVAVSTTDQEVRAEVIEPGEEMAMRFAVMDAFDWHDRARTMVRDQLNWRLVRVVD